MLPTLETSVTGVRGSRQSNTNRGDSIVVSVCDTVKTLHASSYRGDKIVNDTSKKYRPLEESDFSYREVHVWPRGIQVNMIAQP